MSSPSYLLIVSVHSALVEIREGRQTRVWSIVEAVGDEGSAVSDAMRPIGVGDQRSSHRDKVKIFAFQPREEWGEVVFGQAAVAAHHLGHRVVERDRADGNG